MNGIDRVSQGSKLGWTRRCLASSTALALVLGWAASAQADVYNVYTSTIAATTKNANDHYCSLAEAIDSINAGSPQWNCPAAYPGSRPVIELLEGSGGTFAQRHFKISSLTITKDASLYSDGAYIDATGNSALFIGSSATVDIYGVTLTHTGTSAGRLLFNQGRLTISNSTFEYGDVSTLSGSSGPLSGYGGAIYNSGTGVIDYVASDVIFSYNKAKLGGAIYNSTGEISDLRAEILGNTATMAGGGIYNQCTSCNASALLKGRINANGAQIMVNTAVSGGGVFNHGLFYMTDTYVTLNNVSGTNSGETTPAGQSLDGAGGGVVSSPYSATLAAVFNTDGNSSISSNTASGYGGGVFNAGQANLTGIALEQNQALSGAALYSVPQGLFYYCQIGSVDGPATIAYNVLPAPGTNRYSILDGNLLDSSELRKCSITNTTAFENTVPLYCRSTMVRSSAGSVCPQ